MALNPSAFASSITSAHRSASNLDADLKPIGTPTLPNNFSSDFGDAMSLLIAGGTVAGAINTGADPSAIQSAIDSISNTEADADNIGGAFANMMSTVAITPGTPAHGGTAVVSVENDASSKGSEISNIIKSKITDKEQSPPYENLADAMIEAIGTITWKVTEVYSNGSTQTHDVHMA